jgi:prepilin-type N-terminal cleavage/methylation domain-containing protein
MTGVNMEHKRQKNRLKIRRAGFTMVELLTVMAIIAIMALLVLPGFTKMIQSNKDGAARNLIRAALAEAQAHAAKTQKYAGIRFQFDRDGWANGRQYLVLIENVGGATFVTAPNAKPIALPEGIGVISSEVDNFGDPYIDDDATSDGPLHTLDGATTFNIVFSPTGQMVLKSVTVNPRTDDDKVFNYETYVNNGNALLYYDGWWRDSVSTGSFTLAPLWCANEPSTKGLYIFEVNKMQEVAASARWSNYIGTPDVEPVLINMYTGTIIRD